MYVGLDVVVVQETAQDVGIRGGYLLSLKPTQARVLHRLGDGQRHAALGKTQRTDDVGLLLALLKLVPAHYAQVGNSGCHTLGYIVIAEVQDLYGEICALHQQCALACTHLYTSLGQQRHGVLEESSFRLNGYS